MMYHCANCGGYLEENDVISVSYGAKKEAVVCAECFAELCNSMSEIGSREEQEIRKEWEASDKYDRRKEESPDGRI